MKTNKLVLGILAHVDSGKTTLSESMLYLSGSIRKLGRVDHKDAFLDTDELERLRGITIFSKQALFDLGDMQVTLLDTPGHVDFSSEMERTLQVLDYGILVINGADGVQGHTFTLWKLLKHYKIPTFLFVNKMDQTGTDRHQLIHEIEKQLSDHCIDFSGDIDADVFYDKLAMCDEKLMNLYLEQATINKKDIIKAISHRDIFPVYFGSALKLDGVQELMEGLSEYMDAKDYPLDFGAKIFKVARDQQGTRLTYMKITGGELKVKDTVTLEKEKVDQIRIYSGQTFQLEQIAMAGSICAVTGPTTTRSGEGLGFEISLDKPVLKPVLNYKIELPDECDINGMLIKLRQLEEEEPHLNIVWNEKLSEIHAQVMGEIEIEILKSLISKRYGVDVEFGSGNLVYKETIAEAVEGVGHYEPLRHYAEVHLLMEPAEPGEGLIIGTNCSEDDLDRHWQRLILTHLEEKKHIGVLTGSDIADIKITIVAGRGHLKHTEGGDFRQATYRAIRQGLKRAKSVLLEPVYEFRLEIPRNTVGRAMSDIQRMKGSFLEPLIEGDFAIITGEAPVATLKDYHMEVITYTKGIGRLDVTLKGYYPCHNEAEIIKAIGYDAEADIENPTGSVFCAHGAGFNVPWNEVEKYMHVESSLKFSTDIVAEDFEEIEELKFKGNSSIYHDKELEDIFNRTYGPSKRELYPINNRSFEYQKDNKSIDEDFGYYTEIRKKVTKDRYLLVDGYNIIFAWDELKAIAKDNLDAARLKLMDVLCNYQSYRNDTVIVVFDAYKVIGNIGESTAYHNIHVVYTKEAETADQYIERLVHNISHKYDVTVATSDALEQMIILGKGAKRMSAMGLKEEVDVVSHQIRNKYLNQEKKGINIPFHDLDEK